MDPEQPHAEWGLGHTFGGNLGQNNEFFFLWHKLQGKFQLREQSDWGGGGNKNIYIVNHVMLSGHNIRIISKYKATYPHILPCHGKSQL